MRRIAAATTITAMLAVGIATVPAANAGTEATPAAYTIVNASLLVACQLATVDLTDGTTTPLGGAEAEKCAQDLAVAPDGTVWGVTGGKGFSFLVQFDPATGDLLSNEEITGDFTFADLVGGGLAFDAVGTLYAQLVTDEPGCDSAAVCLYTLDRATAAATFVGDPGAANEATELDFLGADCAGNMVTTEGSRENGSAETPWNDVEAELSFRQLDFVDPATGIVTDGPDFDTDFLLAGLDYDRVSGTLYALGTFIDGPVPAEESTDTTAATTAAEEVGPAEFDASLFIVDPATAEVTEVAPLSDPELNVTTLGIAGECVVPVPAVEPIVLVPTFTG